LITICQRWRLAPTVVPFFGDYRFDLEAGRAAGMPTVLYAPGEIPDYATLADHVLPCFTAFPTLWKQFHALV
jgi:phosphoglycolate phosphatase-like HAD superfamily hydrolase